MKVQNKGGKGNPNHDKEGKFTTDEGGLVESATEEVKKVETSHEDDIGPVVLTFNQDSIDDFLDSMSGGKTHGERIEESKKMLETNKLFLDMTNYDELNLNREEKIELIAGSSFEYDKDKLSVLTDEEIEAIYQSECIILADKQLNQKIELLELQKQQIMEKTANDLSDVAGSEPEIYGVWKTTMTSDDYEKVTTKDESGTSSVDRKREYYEKIINDPLSFDDDIEDAKDKLASLDKWLVDCENYLKAKNEIKAKYSQSIADLEDKITELNNKKKNLTSENFLNQVKLAKEYLSNYQDVNAPYSQSRKNAAIWITGGYSEAYKYFGDKMNEKWNTLTPAERNIAKNYTGGGYSKFNKPLRGIKHDPAGYSFNSTTGTFSQAVTNLSNAIDKCTWDEDIWVQRGISDVPIFLLPGAKSAKSLSSMSDKELQSLVGTSFTDGGFYSAGAGKNTGFSSNQIIINTYCPRGTKMIYVAPYSNYGSENEMILQRGYSYRITKIERKGYRYYIDVEVILGSDENKPTGNNLKEIGNKYYYGPRGQTGEKYE